MKKSRQLFLVLTLFGTTAFCSEKPVEKPEYSDYCWWNPFHVAQYMIGTYKCDSTNEDVKRIAAFIREDENPETARKVKELIQIHKDKIEIIQGRHENALIAKDNHYKNALNAKDNYCENALNAKDLDIKEVNLEITRITRENDGYKKKIASLFSIIKKKTNWDKHSTKYMIIGGAVILVSGVAIGVYATKKYYSKKGEPVIIKQEFILIPQAIDTLYDEMIKSQDIIKNSLTTVLTDTKERFLERHTAIGDDFKNEAMADTSKFLAIKNKYQEFSKDFNSLKMIDNSIIKIVINLVKKQTNFLTKHERVNPKKKSGFWKTVSKIISFKNSNIKIVTHVDKSPLMISYKKINTTINTMTFSGVLKKRFKELGTGIEAIVLKNTKGTQKYLAMNKDHWREEVEKRYNAFYKETKNAIGSNDEFEKTIKLNGEVFSRKHNKHVTDIEITTTKNRTKDNLIGMVDAGSSVVKGAINIVAKK